MITMTAREEEVIQKQYYDVHHKVLVEDPNGNFVDLSDLDGMDWIISISGESDVDNMINTMTLEINRNIYKKSLATYMNSSKYNEDGPLVYLNREIILQIAITDINESPDPEWWFTYFDGYIDEIVSTSNPMRIECRDLAGRLTAFIEEEHNYGSDEEEVLLEDIIEDILRDNGFTDFADDLQTPVESEWAILEYTQRKESVKDAINTLIREIGWSFRFKYFRADNKWKPVLYEPDRTPAQEDWTFSSNDYYDVNELSVGVTGVRNAVRINFYEDGEVKDYLFDSDSASIGLYERQYMEVSEEATSEIANTTIAQRFLDAILADLSEPKINHEIELPFFPFVELQDYYKFLANFIHYDSDQDLAVVGYRWEISDGRCRTWIATRGKPISGFYTWLELDSRPGLGKPTIDTPPADPENVSVSAIIGGFEVTNDFSHEKYFDRFKLYRNTEDNFETADLIEEGRKTLWINTSTVDYGQDYYFWLTAMDIADNESGPVLADNSPAQAKYVEDGDVDPATPGAPEISSINDILEVNEPDTPANFNYLIDVDSNVRIRWSQNTEDFFSHYIIEASKDAAFEPIIDEFNLLNHSDATIALNNYWRGYAFTVPYPTEVTALAGGQSGDTSDVWHVGLYEADVNYKPTALITSALLPFGYYSHTIDPVILQPEKIYIIAQGRESGSSSHERVTNINTQNILDNNDNIISWFPDDRAIRWPAAGDENYIVDNEPSSLEDTTRPHIGMTLTDKQVQKTNKVVNSEFIATGISANMKTYFNIIAYGLNKLFLDVEWGAIENATHYELQYKIKDEWNSIVTSDTKIIIENVLFDRDYDFRVRTVNAQGRKSDWSAISNHETTDNEYSASGILEVEIDMPALLRTYVDSTFTAQINFETLLNHHFYGDEDGEFDGDNIAPKTVRTQALAIGSSTRNFNVIKTTFEPNYNFPNTLNRITNTTGFLILIVGPDEEDVTWNISAGDSTITYNINPHYAYFKAPKNMTAATLEFSTEKPDSEDEDNYYFLIGMYITTDDVNEPAIFAASYGFTYIDGNKITTGILNANVVKVVGGGGSVTIDDLGIKVENGKLTVEDEEDEVTIEDGRIAAKSIKASMYEEIRNVLPWNFQENLDSDNPLPVDFHIPTETVNIEKIFITAKADSFRAYSKSTSGGAHDHDVTLESHTHELLVKEWGEEGYEDSWVQTTSTSTDHRHRYDEPNGTNFAKDWINFEKENSQHNHGGSTGDEGAHTHRYYRAHATTGSESSHNHPISRVTPSSYNTGTAEGHLHTYYQWEPESPTGSGSSHDHSIGESNTWTHDTVEHNHDISNSATQYFVTDIIKDEEYEIYGDSHRHTKIPTIENQAITNTMRDWFVNVEEEALGDYHEHWSQIPYAMESKASGVTETSQAHVHDIDFGIFRDTEEYEHGETGVYVELWIDDGSGYGVNPFATQEIGLDGVIWEELDITNEFSEIVDPATYDWFKQIKFEIASGAERIRISGQLIAKIDITA